MAKQAYVSISDLAWDAMGCPQFDALKEGFIGQGVDGQCCEISSGIPKTAKLVAVLYLYEDGSLPDVPNPLSQPSATVMSKRFTRE